MLPNDHRLATVTLPVVALPLVAFDAGTLNNADGLLQYVLVAILAAIPWFEILLVIPGGIGIGLNPIAVGALAFLGNTVAVLAIVLFHENASQRGGALARTMPPPKADAAAEPRGYLTATG